MKSNKQNNPAMASYGIPAWVALTTANKNLAANFYSTLFNWSGPTEQGTLLLAEQPVAAINQHARAALSKWNLHIDVVDLEEVKTKIIKAGGQIMETFSEPGNGGTYALATDHAGTVFAVHQGRQQNGLTRALGTFAWSEVITDDVEASRKFYNEVFSWSLSQPIAGDQLGRRDWLLNDLAVAGLLPRPAAMPKEIPAYWDVFFAVSDVFETVAKAMALGAVNLLPPIDIPHGQIAVFADPVGAVFSILKSNN